MSDEEEPKPSREEFLKQLAAVKAQLAARPAPEQAQIEQIPGMATARQRALELLKKKQSRYDQGKFPEIQQAVQDSLKALTHVIAEAVIVELTQIGDMPRAKLDVEMQTHRLLENADEPLAKAGITLPLQKGYVMEDLMNEARHDAYMLINERIEQASGRINVRADERHGKRLALAKEMAATFEEEISGTEWKPPSKPRPVEEIPVETPEEILDKKIAGMNDDKVSAALKNYAPQLMRS